MDSVTIVALLKEWGIPAMSALLILILGVSNLRALRSLGKFKRATALWRADYHKLLSSPASASLDEADTTLLEAIAHEMQWALDGAMDGEPEVTRATFPRPVVQLDYPYEGRTITALLTVEYYTPVEPEDEEIEDEPEDEPDELEEPTEAQLAGADKEAVTAFLQEKVG